MFHLLYIEELCIAFGVNKNYKLIPCHLIANCLGEENAKYLLFFHAFSGSDTTSSFNSSEKKKAW